MIRQSSNMFTNLFSLTADPAKNSTASGLTQYLPTAETMSTVVGAALGEEDCLKKTACQAGSYVSQVTGKELVLM